MKRILILGPPGAGKSTLARVLGERLNLPVTHLDRLYWTPGWKPTEPDEFRERVSRAVAGEGWVIDGNYSVTYDLRFPRADTAIHLDFSTTTTLYRILRRMIVGLGRVRSDGPDGCPERFDREFVWWTLTFRRLRRPRILAALETYSESLQVITLTDSCAVDRFLCDLDASA